jgi:hypothetical protein
MRVLRCKLMVASWLLGALSLVACSSGGETKSAAGRKEWKLVFTYDGAHVELPLEHLLVYLVEDEREYPEVFEIAGDGVALTGTFPMDCHVSYDENWSVLFGKTIAVDASGGARDDVISYVELPDGSKAFVTGGALIPERLDGSLDGLEGDRTLHGRFTLRIRTGLGEKEVGGRFAVHCVTLG